jgi:hypothetical protein
MLTLGNRMAAASVANPVATMDGTEIEILPGSRAGTASASNPTAIRNHVLTAS